MALDAEVPLALLDQRAAGKRVILITNSEWSYSQAMISYAFDRFLPAGMGWRDLFDLVIVGARKPAFFWESMPLFQVLDAEGRLIPSGPPPACAASSSVATRPWWRKCWGCPALRSSTSATTCTATCMSPRACGAGAPP